MPAMTGADGPSGRSFSKAIGPGILFAGAAIGVSHLVQSTRAGAEFGLSLIVVVLLAHAMKLPAMLFGPRYAAATGTSLLQAYRRQGRHASATFALITFGTMFTIQAAVTIVAAALVKFIIADPVFGMDTPMWSVALFLLVLSAGLIAVGGFGWLDVFLKALMVVMLVTTIFAAALEVPSLEMDRLPLVPVIPAGAAERLAMLAFVVALMGWMPAPLDISVWHSLWTLARKKQTGHAPTRRQSEIDFGIGYALCIVLAVCFVVLGAGELFLKGIEPAAGGPAFAAQLIELYTASIGPWVRPVIAACAVAVMFSTTLTVLDALPRTAVRVIESFRADETPETNAGPCDTCRTRGYWVLLVVIAAGAMAIITRVQGEGFRALVDFATTLSFLGTPALAWFNHRAIVSPDVGPEHRPGPGLRAWSLVGVVFWTMFAAVFVWQRFFTG